mmetsp:Transcript_1375/g.4095  ORF Transcript_1375/g.4095 Transcript_1375/m.4095 type:complete len:202 (-) Transcript_1375:137-742(-)
MSPCPNQIRLLPQMMRKSAKHRTSSPSRGRAETWTTKLASRPSPPGRQRWSSKTARVSLSLQRNSLAVSTRTPTLCFAEAVYFSSTVAVGRPTADSCGATRSSRMCTGARSIGVPTSAKLTASVSEGSASQSQSFVLSPPGLKPRCSSHSFGRGLYRGAAWFPADGAPTPLARSTAKQRNLCASALSARNEHWTSRLTLSK